MLISCNFRKLDWIDKNKKIVPTLLSSLIDIIWRSNWINDLETT